MRPIDLLILGALVYLIAKVEWIDKAHRVDWSVGAGVVLANILGLAGAAWLGATLW